MNFKNNKFKIISSTFFFIIIFIIFSYYLKLNEEFFKNNLDSGILGISIYIFITIFATVVAPFSAIPFLPIAVLLWGPFLTAVFSIISWTIGSVLAFIISRKYGLKIISKFIDTKKIEEYQSYIPKKDLFYGIIIMRIFLPVDVLSYILGIFSKVDLKTYSLATFLGVIPFGFFLTYLGSFNLIGQIIFGIFGIILFTVLYYKVFKNYKKNIIN